MRKRAGGESAAAGTSTGAGRPTFGASKDIFSASTRVQGRARGAFPGEASGRVPWPLAQHCGGAAVIPVFLQQSCGEAAERMSMKQRPPTVDTEKNARMAIAVAERRTSLLPVTVSFIGALS
jgi:hypothetical protein